MKKLLIYLIIFALNLSLVGCKAKEKASKKVGEKIAEKLIEDMGGVEVDIKGDTITMKDDEGTEITMGGTDWPSSDLVKNIPEFEDGKVLLVMEMEDTLVINLDEVSKEDFEKYLEKIKKDFANEVYEINAEGSLSYGGENEGRIGIQIFYSSETGGVSITLAKMRD